MIRVQFNDKQTMTDVQFRLLSESVVHLSGKKLKSNTSGFKTFRLNGDFLGDFSKYVNCKETKDGFIFSKDKRKG